MASTFDMLGDALDGRLEGLPSEAAALLLLSLAQRYVTLFELFEKRLQLTGNLRACLNQLWAGVSSEDADEIAARIESMVPDESTTVDGFHDALAQYIGGVAYAAARGLAGESYEPGGARGVLEALRILLSEAKLGRLEPGEDAAGRAFDASLHQEATVIGELRAIDTLVEAVVGGATVDQMQGLTVGSPFDVDTLEPDLSLGLSRDLAGS